ncbi:MAG: hypothetical protein QME40_06990, partial [bacterium]|nr:hypothetical protein [bacterium]
CLYILTIEFTSVTTEVIKEYILVIQVALSIHKDFVKNLKYTKIYSSGKHMYLCAFVASFFVQFLL